MYYLPVTVNVDGKEYAIRDKGDYRRIIDIIDVANDTSFNSSEIMATSIMMFYEGIETIADIYYNFSSMQKAYDEILKFISLNESNVGHRSNHKLIDWVQDENIIVPDVNKVAGTEIRFLPYLHWWTFIGYYMCVGEGTLSRVVGIRSKIAEGRKLDKDEQNFRKNNPQYFTFKSEQKEADLMFAEIWDSEEGK